VDVTAARLLRYKEKSETRDLERLVRSASKGDKGAAAVLFDRYYPRVYRYALVRLKSRMDAEDVAAETFAKVLRELKRFKWQGGGFEAWLFRIASNAVVDHFRRSGREGHVEQEAEGVWSRDERTPETAALEKERAQRLHVLIAALSADQREVLALRFGAGLGSDEIAKVMNRKPNAVRQLQFRALASLRSRFPDPQDI
jgi:RNA polymerase sigma-70 factor (ECF subfamily)